MPAVALTIAGSDPSGGAGIQADLKTFHQFGVYGEAVITLLTVQNSQLVSWVELLRADLIVKQIEAILSDIPPDAAKTGALGSRNIVEAVAELAPSLRFPLVVDPVMISKHGARLMDDGAAKSLKEKLLPHASLVTPNIPEAEALTGMKIESEDDMLAAACRILDFGCKAVLLKGGHLTGEATDVLVGCGEPMSLRGRRVHTNHTHGTGCTYSAAITAGLANGQALPEAVRNAKLFIQSAIESAPGFGAGNGPVDHFAPVGKGLSTSARSGRPYRSRP
ncbi:MAG TPA: bifunctional hydroxymethylpyrimidine kinase/phosphomethylpyrimidine kinase [Bryobacteraceae bacterium]|jgi:hydroxymethylpyrimidine/phosphomethylpyrimidine kinase|nr:bifunctional hydroxymethylpyrimidine kinase/phosphomethylpyrimidine kinase [Bryobacteraceae bacterium]